VGIFGSRAGDVVEEEQKGRVGIGKKLRQRLDRGLLAILEGGGLHRAAAAGLSREFLDDAVKQPRALVRRKPPYARKLLAAPSPPRIVGGQCRLAEAGTGLNQDTAPASRRRRGGEEMVGDLLQPLLSPHAGRGLGHVVIEGGRETTGRQRR